MNRFEHFFKADSRRKYIILESHERAIEYIGAHFMAAAQEAISNRGKFFVALSGGSTPKAIYSHLAKTYRQSLDWTKVYCFFSDERAVSPHSIESNYHSAITSGLSELPIPENQIYRMKAESNIGSNAREYEELIREMIPHFTFDLVMLGMGDDGHTASLFPHTEALKVTNRLVVQNHIPSKNCDRMTFTFPLINQARAICFYVLGGSKKEMLKTVLTSNLKSLDFPSTCVGTEENPAIWIMDKAAAELI